MNKYFNLEKNKKKINPYSIIKFIETNFSKNSIEQENIKVGDIIKIEYNISNDNSKNRIEYYEGLVIAKNNKNINKTITLRRNIKGIILKHIFPLYSSRILSISIKQNSKIRKSKLFFIENLSEKKIKKKLKL